MHIHRPLLRLVAAVVMAITVCAMPAHAQDQKAAATAAPTTLPATAAAQPTMQQRLDRLCEQLEKQRVDLHIPGFALAIVKDDKVILSRGFGVSDVEKNTPVTPETLFAIGSSSKAFAAALVAMMIDEGKMSLDDLVRKHLPDFHLFDKEADEQITIRDLLCHRCGLERTDLVWAGGKATREEILAAIATAEPTAKFREKFQYQNVMYLAAGMAAANAAGLNGDYDALMAQRIFQPLGMVNSNTSLAAAKANPHLSLGYMWDEEKKEYKHLPMRDLHAIAPAGAINSNIIDMVQWLRLQLGKGEVDGKRLIEAVRFDEMRTKEIDMGGGGMNYGLGWMLHDWQGKNVVEHGGNIDGFGAQVTLVPEEHLGYVLLTNVTATPLQQMSINLVCDALLGEWTETLETPLDPTTVEKYFGKYHLDVLKADLTVQMKDGKLAVDVPNQTLYVLKKPNAEGKWVFELTDTIAVSFEENDAGEVMWMTMYQNGRTMECLKEGVTLPVDIGLDAAQKYLGTFHDERLKADVTVLHRNGRLAVDVPKQMIYDLRMPDADGKWYFRMTDAIALKFDEDAAGAVMGITMYQGGKEFVLPRVEGAKAEAVPSVDEVLALHERGCGVDQLAELGNIRMTGTMRMVNQGLNGIRFTVIARGEDHFALMMDMGVFGWINVGQDGETGWGDSMMNPAEALPADQVSMLLAQNPMLPVMPWRSVFDKIEITKVERIEEHDLIVVSLGKGEKMRCQAFIDRATGRPMRMDYKVPMGGLGNIETKEALTDWREVDGAWLPYHWEIESDLFGKTIVDVAKVETNVDLPADAFAMPKR